MLDCNIDLLNIDFYILMKVKLSFNEIRIIVQIDRLIINYWLWLI
jgi:hypothetical protein